MYELAQHLAEKPTKKMAAARHSFGAPVDHKRASLNMIAMSADIRMLDQGECAIIVTAEIEAPEAIEGFDARLTIRNSSGITTLVITLSSSTVFDRKLQSGRWILRWGSVAVLAPGAYRGALSFFSVSGSQLRGHGVYQKGLENLMVEASPDAGTKTPGVVTCAELLRSDGRGMASAGAPAG